MLIYSTELIERKSAKGGSDPLIASLLLRFVTSVYVGESRNVISVPTLLKLRFET